MNSGVPTPGHLLKLSQIELTAGSARKRNSSKKTGTKLAIAHLRFVAASPMVLLTGLEGDDCFEFFLSFKSVTIVSLVALLVLLLVAIQFF
jgi:hypothetical protein